MSVSCTQIMSTLTDNLDLRRQPVGLTWLLETPDDIPVLDEIVPYTWSMRIIACADMMLVRDGDGDWAKATSLIDDSLAISNELGMRPLMDRVLSRREILKV